MEKLKVGVWILENYNPHQGGGFTYYSAIIDCISRTSFSNAEICFVGNHKADFDKIGLYNYHLIKLPPEENGLYNRVLNLVGVNILKLSRVKKYFRKLEKKRYSEIHSICQVIYYPLPMCKYSYFPFIYTLFDTAHLSTFAFPEVTGEGQFEARKELYDNILFKALMVFCESESGRLEALHYLKINAMRMRVLPLIPSGVISDKLDAVKPEKVDENSNFIHYPAQFWAHKNHYNLVMAFKELTVKYPDLKLVFTGSDKGNKDYIFKVIKENGLENKVIDLGFISLGELKWLYLHSKGLVMPSLLGPTNMPPLEALALGCPVAISDLAGHREQLGDNAIYFNPLDINEIKEALEKLINSKFEHPIRNFHSIEDNMKLLDKYFSELNTIRNLWA